MEARIIRCNLSDRFWLPALGRVDAMNKNFKGSHRGRKAQEVGFLGEVVAEAWFERCGIHFKDDRDKYTHDYTLNGSITLDVKTKDRTVVPKIYYENSVPLYQTDYQRPEYYLFISLLRDKGFPPDEIQRFTHAYILGAIDLITLESSGKRWDAKDVDPSNGTKFWTACINVNMGQLIPLSDIKRTWGAVVG